MVPVEVLVTAAGAPVDGAAVELTWWSGDNIISLQPPTRRLTTGSDGRCRTEVPATSVQVRVVRPGHHAYERGLNNIGPAVRFDVQLVPDEPTAPR